jgi:hypothetical protein
MEQLEANPIILGCHSDAGDWVLVLVACSTF